MKMKLLFSVVFICTLLTTSYAQINKGSVWIGSNLSYEQRKDRPAQQPIDRETRTVSILPSFGVAIKENLVVGIFGNYTNARREHDGYLIKRNEKTYGGGLFARRYVPVFKRFYMYGEGRLGYNKLVTEDNWDAPYPSSSKLKSWVTGLTFTPGIAYGITRNMLLEAGFASLFDAMYRNTETNSEPYYQPHRVKSFTLGVNLENISAFHIGFRFLINKKA